ncbi:MAG: ATP-binding cassette domain-containing protein [Bifidobacteriaceae bacterium]|jgi:putative ABC transport system ATP-binding protein|nr:ATP-binding cassette domain-containing protein [Bifidobacteriaceae bacterium]
MRIELQNLSKSFGDKRLFNNVSAIFEPATMNAITGKSGTGKTTLLNCITLLEKIDSGVILYDGKQVQNLSHSKQIALYRKTVSFVFQNYGLVDDWTVAENLKLPLTFNSSKADKKESICKALELVGLKGKDQMRVYSLSGGEQQRVAIAAAILKDAKVIFCDEPSAALDSENVELVLNILDALREQGRTILISSHDSNVVSRCQNVYQLRNGEFLKVI